MLPLCPKRYIFRKITISHITFPFDGLVGNLDPSQFQNFEVSSSGFSAKTYMSCQRKDI